MSHSRVRPQGLALMFAWKLKVTGKDCVRKAPNLEPCVAVPKTCRFPAPHIGKHRHHPRGVRIYNTRERKIVTLPESPDFAVFTSPPDSTCDKMLYRVIRHHVVTWQFRPIFPLLMWIEGFQHADIGMAEYEAARTSKYPLFGHFARLSESVSMPVVGLNLTCDQHTRATLERDSTAT